MLRLLQRYKILQRRDCMLHCYSCLCRARIEFTAGGNHEGLHVLDEHHAYRTHTLFYTLSGETPPSFHCLYYFSQARTLSHSYADSIYLFFPDKVMLSFTLTLNHLLVLSVTGTYIRSHPHLYFS